ncbi:DUF6064 family protein [Ramlibacter tataouinensis]|uniref:Candidate membrane protein n=1 Tax=Ramlibacter tataouinensis (strain ATCC BAA-407 / DSM 14655 / LMG 21543 / TTB310) TaxID=365046 RepID=F5Y178_RAMTT|nr:DUF6064 family protein [Ramlibacter tataouinensis]AEG93479.1 candidate membrane protein [Ramlibacter tataouinensis TTB310]
MSEWWTYRLSDFLMFSPRTYARLVALYHEELWPLQWLGLAAGLAALGLALASRRHPVARRALMLLLAAAWAWVGWAFAWQRYAAINLAAPHLAAACGLQAVLCLLAAFGADARPGASRAPWIGDALAFAAVLGFPAASLLAGRPWAQAEVFASMPDPTALASLGLWWAAGPRRAWLLPVPLAVLALGLATRWALAG